MPSRRLDANMVHCWPTGPRTRDGLGTPASISRDSNPENYVRRLLAEITYVGRRLVNGRERRRATSTACGIANGWASRSAWECDRSWSARRPHVRAVSATDMVTLSASNEGDPIASRPLRRLFELLVRCSTDQRRRAGAGHGLGRYVAGQRPAAEQVA